jgi:hypothetical protein
MVKGIRQSWQLPNPRVRSSNPVERFFRELHSREIARVPVYPTHGKAFPFSEYAHRFGGIVVSSGVRVCFGQMLPIRAASRVRTNDIDFSSWASHTITERIRYTPYYNKRSCVRTIPIFILKRGGSDLSLRKNGVGGKRLVTFWVNCPNPRR